MRSLFVKLFVSFVLITLLASFTTVMISFLGQIGPYGELKKQRQHHQLRALNQSLAITGLAAVKILKNGGKAELVNYLHEVERPGLSHIFLLQDDNTTLSGRSLPSATARLAEKARNSNSRQHSITPGKIMVARPLFSTEGQSLIIVGTTDRLKRAPIFARGDRKKLFPPRPFLRQPFGLPLIIMLLIAAAGCYLLARSLTAPIRRLRTATQQMTKGDFSTRIDLLGGKGNEIADLSRDFNTMAQRTQALLLSQKRLLRDISHELRSPLTRQNVALELARQRCSEAEPFLNRIEKESYRLNELIDKLLILTRIEGDVDNLPKKPVQLTEVLNTIVRDADFEATSSKRYIEILKSDDVTVLGSAEMLSRAFENVIRNGLRYTAPGSAVEIKINKNDTQVLISIQDHGPGVASEHLEQIFKPFFRVSDSRNRDSGGTGVGLAIAKQAIVQHGGTIEAKKGKYGGLLVEIRLPAEFP